MSAGKKTMTLNLTEPEMTILEQHCEKKRTSPRPLFCVGP